METAKIYFLYIENDETPIYIGSTRQPLKIRRENHLSDFRSNNKKADVIKKTKQLGYKINIKELEACEFNKRLERESYWIDYYKKRGINLLNMSDSAYSNTEKQKNTARKLMIERMKIPSEIKKIRDAALKKSIKVIINGVIYDSINEASRTTGISSGLISSVCNKKRRSKKYDIKHGYTS